MIEQIALYFFCFSVFVLLQSFFINGVHECFTGKKYIDEFTKKEHYDGMIFYMMNPEFFERIKNKTIVKPLYRCVKCMASVWSAITFFPLVIYIFGFHVIELFIWGVDCFILVPLNYKIYKML